MQATKTQATKTQAAHSQTAKSRNRTASLALSSLAFGMVFGLTYSPLAGTPVKAQSAPAPATASDKYQPAETSVAVLPVLNQTKGGWDDLKDREDEKGEQELVKHFQECGFPLVDDAQITRSLSALGMDPQTFARQFPEALIKSDALSKIGKAANARLVALLVITDARSGSHFSLFGNFHKEGGATVKLWLVDVAENRAILTEVTKSSKSSGAGGFLQMAGTGGSSLSLRAIGGATSAALSDFIKHYPLVSKDEKQP